MDTKYVILSLNHRLIFQYPILRFRGFPCRLSMAGIWWCLAETMGLGRQSLWRPSWLVKANVCREKVKEFSLPICLNFGPRIYLPGNWETFLTGSKIRQLRYQPDLAFILNNRLGIYL